MPVNMVNRVPYLSHPAKKVASGETRKADVPWLAVIVKVRGEMAYTYGQGESPYEGVS